MFTLNVNCTNSRESSLLSLRKQNQSTMDEKGLNFNKVDSDFVKTGSTVVVKYYAKSNFKNTWKIFDENTTNNIGKTIGNGAIKITNSVNELNSSIVKDRIEQQILKKTEAKAHLYIYLIFVLMWIFSELLLFRADLPTVMIICRVIGVVSFLLSGYYLGIVI